MNSLRAFLLTAVLLPLMSGCVADEPAEPAEAPTTAPVGPSAPVKANETHEISSVKFDGTLSVAWCGAVCIGNPNDEATITVRFPDNYTEAVLEMEWVARQSTSETMDLMVHEKGTAADMVASAVGTSPILLLVPRKDLAPKEYDLLAYVEPGAVDAVAVAQDFTIYATFFDGPAPPDFAKTA